MKRQDKTNRDLLLEIENYIRKINVDIKLISEKKKVLDNIEELFLRLNNNLTDNELCNIIDNEFKDFI